jgi:hypothetical protein
VRGASNLLNPIEHCEKPLGVQGGESLSHLLPKGGESSAIIGRSSRGSELRIEEIFRRYNRLNVEHDKWLKGAIKKGARDIFDGDSVILAPFCSDGEARGDLLFDRNPED